MTFYSPPAHKRHAHQHYPTPPDLAQALIDGLALAGLVLPRPVYDPCCGAGALLDALGGQTIGSDLHPDDYPARLDCWTTPVNAKDPDALARARGSARALATNPPYARDAQPIIKAGIELIRRGAIDLAAFLVPLPWESAAGRRNSRLDLVRQMQVRIVPSWRAIWIPGTKDKGKMNHIWLVWTDAPPAFPVTVYLRKPQT